MIYPKERQAQACRPEAELIRDYGRHPLAFLGLAPENGHFLAAEGIGLINYRLVGKVAVVLGEPICPPEAYEQVTRCFLDFCARQKWHAAFYQASPHLVATARLLKLRIFKMGEEALLYPHTFSLRGSALANVRTSCRRAERDGVSLSWYEGVPPAEVIQQLEHVSSTWLQRKDGTQAPEMGFSMGRLDQVIESAERAEMIAHLPFSSNNSRGGAPRLVTAVATTSDDTACAFVTFTPIYGTTTSEVTVTGSQPEVHGWGWSLDLMRRMPDAPPGVMELLLVRAIDRFRSCGAQVISLGMVAMADTGREMAPLERYLASLVTERLGLFESRQTLFTFKQKFQPCWESRYLVANTTLGLPKIALAVMQLRNYSGGRVTRLIK